MRKSSSIFYVHININIAVCILTYLNHFIVDMHGLLVEQVIEYYIVYRKKMIIENWLLNRSTILSILRFVQITIDYYVIILEIKKTKIMPKLHFHCLFFYSVSTNRLPKKSKELFGTSVN